MGTHMHMDNLYVYGIAHRKIHTWYSVCCIRVFKEYSCNYFNRTYIYNYITDEGKGDDKITPPAVDREPSKKEVDEKDEANDNIGEDKDDEPITEVGDKKIDNVDDKKIDNVDDKDDTDRDVDKPSDKPNNDKPNNDKLRNGPTPGSLSYISEL